MYYKIKKYYSYLNTKDKFKRTIKYIYNNPNKSLNYFFRIGSAKWIKKIFNNKDEYERYYDEINNSKFIINLNTKLKNKFSEISGETIRGSHFIAGSMKIDEACNIYSIIRKIKPGHIIETGVCNGFSTAVILEAIRKNGKGILYSIDYPEFADDRTYEKKLWEGKGGAVVPSDEESGWIVPENLKKFWKLYIDKSENALPPLLDELNSIDMFIHDSEHSYDNQIFEFNSAIKSLSSNGILIASDISWNDAFDHFNNQNKNVIKSYFIDHNLAIVVKD